MRAAEAINLRVSLNKNSYLRAECVILCTVRMYIYVRE